MCYSVQKRQASVRLFKKSYFCTCEYATVGKMYAYAYTRVESYSIHIGIVFGAIT